MDCTYVKYNLIFAMVTSVKTHCDLNDNSSVDILGEEAVGLFCKNNTLNVQMATCCNPGLLTVASLAFLKQVPHEFRWFVKFNIFVKLKISVKMYVIRRSY